jgi:hypothetical protein
MSNKYSKSQLKKTKHEELIQIGLNEFGTVLDPTLGKDELIDEILDLQDSEADAAAEVSPGNDSGAAADSAVPVVSTDNTGHKDEVTERVGKQKMYTIRIDEAADPQEKEYVDVSVNGFNRRIKRGMDVVVPHEVVEVLRNAIETRHFRNDKTGDQEARQAPRFGWHIIKEHG